MSRRPTVGSSRQTPRQTLEHSLSISARMKMKAWSKENFLPIFFGLSACSWMPHWACHYYRLETGTSFVVGSWSFTAMESALSLVIYGLLIVLNLSCIAIVRWRFQVSLVTGICHILIGSVHVVRLCSPFTFEVFGYSWPYGASLREIIIVLSYGILCLVIAWKLLSQSRSTSPL